MLKDLSSKSGVVLTGWTIAKVISLYRSSSLSHIDNYRPISVLPTLSKILERMFYNQLIAHFEESCLLFTNQFGFRSKRSTEQAGNIYLDHTRGEADKGKLKAGFHLCESGRASTRPALWASRRIPLSPWIARLSLVVGLT